MTTTNETDGRVESQMARAKAEAGRQRLEEIEQELDAAGAMVGQTAVEYERAKYARDRALKRHTKMMGMHRRLLDGEDL
jgi:hypothetical protein